MLQLNQIIRDAIEPIIEGVSDFADSLQEFTAHTYPNGEKNNFCGACGKQMNQNVFKHFEVYLFGGEVKSVKAVNKKEAASRVIFEGKDYKFDAQTGQPIGDFTVHPKKHTAR